MPHQLPPLNALRVFEVTARAGSYTEAARELHLTHGAVSRQIQLLEAALGQPLFRREGQRMVATAHARAYAREISQAFDHISDASRRYGRRSRRPVIRVNAPATMAMRWLIPRLTSFRLRYPDVEVRVSTAFSHEPALRGSFDVAIRRLPLDTVGYEVQPLFTESNTVIASPALLARYKLRHPRDLASAIWLSTETRPGEWEAWLQAAKLSTLRPIQDLRFDHFFVTLQAVVDGLGVGIGPFPTLDSDHEQKRVALPFPDIRSAGRSYGALIPQDSDKPRYLLDFLQWLGGDAAAAPASALGGSRAVSAA